MDMMRSIRPGIGGKTIPSHGEAAIRATSCCYGFFVWWLVKHKMRGGKEIGPRNLSAYETFQQHAPTRNKNTVGYNCVLASVARIAVQPLHPGSPRLHTTQTARER